MEDLVQQRLATIISNYGRSACEDPRRCEALLRDLCGDYKKEVNVLVSALRERVTNDLLRSHGEVPREILIAQLVKRLQDGVGLSEDAAKWAVETWAVALGIISLSEQEEETLWRETLKVDQKEGCESYIEKYPSGKYSSKARERLGGYQQIVPPALPAVVTPGDSSAKTAPRKSSRRSSKLAACVGIALMVGLLAIGLVNSKHGKERPVERPVAPSSSTPARSRSEGQSPSNAKAYIDGIWHLQWTGGLILHDGELIMRGSVGKLRTMYFSPDVGRTETVDQTMHLQISSQGIVLLGENPVFASTGRPHPKYIPDNFLFQVDTYGSIACSMCDDADNCSPVNIEFIRPLNR